VPASVDPPSAQFYALVSRIAAMNFAPNASFGLKHSK
jgi:hypothetical protein